MIHLTLVRRLLDSSVMSDSRRLPVCLLLCFLAVANTATAGPITGDPSGPITGDPAAGLPVGETTNTQSDDEERRRAEAAAFDLSFSPLFDTLGPLIRVSAPIYLSLTPAGGFVEEAFSASSAPDLSNVGFQLAIEPLTSTPIEVIFPAAVPEPATLLLLAPAMALVARRLKRRLQR